MPWFLGNSQLMVNSWANIIVPLVVWSFFWKGLALWSAARAGEKVWFIIILILNTAGILEIIYLLFVAKIFSTFGAPRRSKKK